jgi:hypothetical protein
MQQQRRTRSTTKKAPIVAVVAQKEARGRWWIPALAVLTLMVLGVGLVRQRSMASHDLKSFCQVVLRPTSTQEREAIRRWKETGPAGEKTVGRVNWLKECETQLRPAYQHLLDRACHFKASSSDVKTVNSWLVATCKTAIAQLDTYVDALRAEDAAAAARAGQELAMIDLDQVGRDVRRIASRHHVQL